MCSPVIYRKSEIAHTQRAETKDNAENYLSFKNNNEPKISVNEAEVSPVEQKKSYASNELMRRKQIENHMYEMRRLEMRREDTLKQGSMKNALSRISLEAFLKEREKAIAKSEYNQAYLIREGAISGLGPKLKEECRSYKLLNDVGSKTREDERAEAQSDSEEVSEEVSVKAASAVQDNDGKRQKYYNWMASKRISQIKSLEEGIDKQLDWALQSIGRYGLH